MMKIAFIGLGNMGAPMASNLLKSGNRVLGFDLSAESARIAASRGIPLAKDPKAAVDGAEVVVTMLPSGKHVRMVWSGLLPLVSWWRAAKTHPLNANNQRCSCKTPLSLWPWNGTKSKLPRGLNGMQRMF